MNDHLEVIFERDDLALLDAPSRRLALRQLLAERGALTELQSVVDRIDGYGPLSALMRDPAVTDILVNGHDEVWVERGGVLAPSEIGFDDAEDLNAFVERMLGRAGRRADASHPIEDARLPDGSRIHVVMPPLAGAEPVVSIRRFASVAWDLDALVELGTLTDGEAGRLSDLVARRATLLVAGPTGAGKTTLLNALLTAIPRGERVITIEETCELRRPEGHHVALVARSPNPDGAGGVDLADLLRAALRMRPDRIVVGEVRGPEAVIAVDALSTGHAGGMLTVHAAAAAAALDRLARLMGTGSSARAHVGAAIDAVVVMNRVGGRRHVQEIACT